MKPVYSVVIPAHNEESRIISTLRSYACAFEDSEVIFVLDGCTDKTADIVRAAAAQYSCLRMIELPRQLGKGGAIVAGMTLAGADVVAFTDADGATGPDELRRLCGLLGCADAVIGSRWLPGSDVVVPQPFVRRAASRVFNFLVRSFFGLRVSDTQCGAKAFRAKAIAPVLAEVETSNFAFDVDLLLALVRRRGTILEVPTRWCDVGGSKVELVRGALKMLIAILRLRLRLSRFSKAVPAFDRVFRPQLLNNAAIDGGV